MNADIVIIFILLWLHLFTDALMGGGPGLVFLWCTARIIIEMPMLIYREITKQRAKQ